MLRLVLLVLGLGVACLAYRESENFQRQTGVTPWRLPSWVWAIIGFVSLVLCAILLAIARRTTKPDQYAPSYAPSAWSPTPLYSAAPWTAPGWHPDPSGRYQLRYWDGMQWTAHVSTLGKTKSDPL